MIKSLIISAVLSSVLFFTGCQEKPAATSVKAVPAEATPAITQVIAEETIVDAGCGMCTYHIPGVEHCETWVNIDNKKLKVTGIEHSAHKSGLCKAGKHEVKITGSIAGDTIITKSIEVIK
ncbi:DUF6370 family protein [Lentisphaera profundi]|uniref:DUF6370 family protein n=1 Tax=Lentisphaera profundi TaxID=1658616 RepID=A0ABY7VRD1_9BACT|nr:DUF6370 family protein [Lentisphaera profundi]WDE95349.1 DUF6370 family protein [Lentisphaera profundi]